MVATKPKRSVKGDLHPSKRAARDKMRAPPERIVERTDDWRFRIRGVMRALGNPSVVELWRGASRLNGEPIVVLAACLRARTGDDANNKTGDMVQVYILPQSEDPTAATKSGKDVSVCGSCVHRPAAESGMRDCYVNTSWAPRNLWLSWRSGAVPFAPVGVLDGAPVRFGAWGDPAAVPLEVWAPLVEGSITYTGYTQEWPALDVTVWGWLMASVIGEDEQLAARDQGWRTFRTAYDGDPDPGAMEGERECLATAKGIPCVGCGGCGGLDQPLRSSYALRVHGMRAHASRAKL